MSALSNQVAAAPWPASAYDEDLRARTHTSLAVGALVIATLTVWAFADTSSLRYALYLAPALIVAVGAFIHRGVVAIDRGGFAALLIYATAVGGSLMTNPHLGFMTQRDILIIAGYLALFTVPLRATSRLADAMLIALMAALAIEVSQKGLTGGFSFSASEGIAESALAFPLGVLMIYFVSERSWGRAIVTAFLLFLCFKRIAFAGLGLGVALWFAALILPDRLLRPIAILTVVLVSLTALFSTEIFEFAVVALNLEGVNANSISLGRERLASVLWFEQQRFDSLEMVFGAGPGAADQTLLDAGIDANPHNDWLKIYFDYGLFGFIALHAALAAACGGTRTGLAIYVYTATIFMTDNTLIYTEYFMIAALVLALVKSRPGTDTPAEPGGGHAPARA